MKHTGDIYEAIKWARIITNDHYKRKRWPEYDHDLYICIVNEIMSFFENKNKPRKSAPPTECERSEHE